MQPVCLELVSEITVSAGQSKQGEGAAVLAEHCHCWQTSSGYFRHSSSSDQVSSLQIMMHPYGRISQVHAGFLHQVHVQFVGVDSSLP